MRTCNIKKVFRSGFSIMELSIVLGVCGIVIAGIWGIVNVVWESYRRDLAAQQIMLVVKGTRDLYAGRSSIEDTTSGINANFANLTDYLIRQNVIPNEMIRNRTCGAAPCLLADTPWGPLGALTGTAMTGNGWGGFGVIRDPQGGSNQQQFVVALRGLKRDSCVALAVRMATSGPEGLVQVEYNNATTKNPELVTVTSALTDCQNNILAAGSRLDFHYRLRSTTGS